MGLVKRGMNIVELQGEVVKPEFKSTSRGYPYFRCRLAVPITHRISVEEIITKNNHVNLVAWGELAESMKYLRTGHWIRVVGNLQQRRYESKCVSCNSPKTVFFTDVLVSNFVEVE